MVFDTASVELIRRAAEQHGLTTRDLVAGAGHDAVQLSSAVPTAMVFIPCVGGISHAEAEDILPQWAVNGANVLLSAVLAAADEKAG